LSEHRPQTATLLAARGQVVMAHPSGRPGTRPCPWSGH